MKNCFRKKTAVFQRGFTVMEVLIVVAILVVLGAIVIGDYATYQKKTDLQNAVQEFIAVLQVAQERTLASDNGAQYGVHISTAVSPNIYTLFQGASYASRVTSYDQPHSVPKNVQFSSLNIGAANDIVFDRLVGTTANSGSLSLQNTVDTSQTKTLYISGQGTVGFVAPSTIADTRVTDSRHIQFDYSRVIDTANETITLTFDNSVAAVVPISAYLVSGEISWQGTVAVGGINQVVDFHTHRLNNPDTEFSIHRDRRYNTKSLKITISGDSGSLAEYSADGLTTTHTSAYVSNVVWQ